MSDFDKLLATLMAGGSSVNVTVIQAVHAGGVVNIKNGCVDVEKSGAPTPKKAQGENKSQVTEADDDHNSAADDGPAGRDEDTPIEVTPVERTRGSERGSQTPQNNPKLEEVKNKLLRLSEELVNGVKDDVEKLNNLNDDQLQSILDCDDTDLDDLDGILDSLFPDLA